MSLALYKRVIKDFLESGKPEVLIIKGEWGIGKTHFWNSELNENNANVQKYSYASLFNISSIEELKTNVFIKTHRPTNNKNTTYIEQLKNRYSPSFKALKNRKWRAATSLFLESSKRDLKNIKKY